MKYIFWDFNGTLLNDVELCHHILNEMLIEEKREPISMEHYLDIFDFPIESYYQKVFDLEKTPFKILANRFIEKYQPRSLEVFLNRDAIELVQYYRHKGYKQIILSASKTSNLMEQLKYFHIDYLFDDILGIDDHYAASKLEVGKSYIKNHAIAHNKAVFIGDTLHDAEIAKSLKMKCILYSKGHQSRERLKGHNIIDDFKQLLV